MSYGDLESPPVEPPRVSHRKRNLALVLALLILVAAFAGVYYLNLFGSSKQPWLFKGAYGIYSGQTTFLAQTINFTIRLQIVDFNSTQVEMLTYYSLKTPSSTDTNQTTSWNKLSSNLDYSGPLGLTLSRAYNTTRLVGLNTIDCTAYEYSGTTQGVNSDLTAFVSRSVGFPVEFTLSVTAAQSSTNLTLDLALVHTNIPGLVEG